MSGKTRSTRCLSVVSAEKHVECVFEWNWMFCTVFSDRKKCKILDHPILQQFPQFAERAEMMLGGGVKKSSHGTYVDGAADFIRTLWKLQLDIHQWPPPTEHLLIYIIQCSLRPNSYGTIRKKLRGTMYLAQLIDGQWHEWSSEATVRIFMKWIAQCIPGRVAQTKAFARKELLLWCQFCWRRILALRAKEKPVAAFAFYHFWVAMMVQFTLGLRISEVVHPTKAKDNTYGIRMKDVRFVYSVGEQKMLLKAKHRNATKANLYAARIKLQNSKTKKQFQDAEVWLGRTHFGVDPLVHLWKIHKRLKDMAHAFPNAFRARANDHLFQRKGAPLSIAAYRRRFAKSVRFLGFIDCEFRTTHSGRKTFFTMLSRAGVNKQEICSAGRWILPDSASVYRVWNESDGVRFAKVFWSGALEYDECVVEYPDDIPKALKRIIEPMTLADGAKKKICAVLDDVEEE